jgi:hypothetical protein
MTSAAEKYWNDFLAVTPDVAPGTPFQVWHFGNTPEMALELAQLVIAREKDRDRKSRRGQRIETPRGAYSRGLQRCYRF